MLTECALLMRDSRYKAEIQVFHNFFSVAYRRFDPLKRHRKLVLLRILTPLSIFYLTPFLRYDRNSGPNISSVAWNLKMMP